MMFQSYNQPVKHAHESAVLKVEEDLFESMYELFQQIGLFWGNLERSPLYRKNLLAFMENRIELNPCYLLEYQNAQRVIALLIEELGKEAAYKKLFTDKAANIAPPQTRLARARQLVSNEFVSFQLAIGGFKSWGAKNYLGYFGGANISGQPPYRIAK